MVGAIGHFILQPMVYINHKFPRYSRLGIPKETVCRGVDNFFEVGGLGVRVIPHASRGVWGHAPPRKFLSLAWPDQFFLLHGEGKEM